MKRLFGYRWIGELRVNCLRFSFRSVGDVCSGELNVIGVNKKLYIGKRNYIVDVLLVGGNNLNMAYLSIPHLRNCPRPKAEDNLKPVKR